MKILVLFLVNFFLFLPLTVFAGEGNKKGPVLTFENEGHDYGTVYTDDLPETYLDIIFKNTGDEPLILSGVRACCGTRVTQWPREPILPGEKGAFNIEFRLAPRPHRISRIVIVTYNNEDDPIARFRITGQVEERD